MQFDTNKHTIFLTLTGSRVYGTHTQESDYDYRGVVIPPREYFLGYLHRFEQSEQKGEADKTLFGIRKFFGLAADNNPNIIELLYIPTKYWQTSSHLWERIVENRHLFLSQKAYHTFRGYATSQLKRMNTHRQWLLQGDLQKPQRKDFGLPERVEIDVSSGLALVQQAKEEFNVEPALAEVARLAGKATAKEIRQTIWEFLERTLLLSRSDIEDRVWSAMSEQIGFDTNLMHLLQKEKAYAKAMRHYKSWLRWKSERNPERKHMEEAVGYDTKHATHLVRLLLMCEYIFKKKTVMVTLPEVEYLRDIRFGRVDYDSLMAEVECINERIEAAKKDTTLRHSPDRKAIDAMCVDIVDMFLTGSFY